MSKLEFNYDNLNGYAVPNLKGASDYIHNASIKASQLSVPYDFVYRNYLATLSKKLSNYQKDVSGLADKIVSINNQIDESLIQFSKVLGDMQSTAIPLNDSSVNNIV